MAFKYKELPTTKKLTKKPTKKEEHAQQEQAAHTTTTTTTSTPKPKPTTQEEAPAFTPPPDTALVFATPWGKMAALKIWELFGSHEPGIWDAGLPAVEFKPRARFYACSAKPVKLPKPVPYSKDLASWRR